MKEYKIVVDFTEKEAFRIFEREIASTSFFTLAMSGWKFKESTPSHDEAKTAIAGYGGYFRGTYDKDSVIYAVNDEVRMAKDKTYSAEGLEVKRVGQPAEFLDENEDVLHKRVMYRNKK